MMIDNTYNRVIYNGQLTYYHLGNTECCPPEWHTAANVLSTATERWTRNGKLTMTDSSSNNHVVASANLLVSHFLRNTTTTQVLKQRQKTSEAAFAQMHKAFCQNTSMKSMKSHAKCLKPRTLQGQQVAYKTSQMISVESVTVCCCVCSPSPVWRITA